MLNGLDLFILNGFFLSYAYTNFTPNAMSNERASETKRIFIQSYWNQDDTIYKYISTNETTFKFSCILHHIYVLASSKSFILQQLEKL